MKWRNNVNQKEVEGNQGKQSYGSSGPLKSILKSRENWREDKALTEADSEIMGQRRRTES
jgi:hypothetical protein